ncbi:nitroreductase family protein [Mariniblastus fucicola]|uniref:Malonic semialdehyde reductase n=1 Tax=Mariniblastus fucicola TaxID=980251 RepID=A0A5B9PE26_9BACT|nr:nitroreductase family protein [Mariniblastus fucicola]QEG24947.1 malonic semialdehyde reductase [Mariniblastus fucicola]
MTTEVLGRALAKRTADHPIEEIFLKRWSPRAMDGNPIDDNQLMSLFEAARWAPSTYNEQEWRFLYAKRDTKPWTTYLDLLVDANQKWCKDAAALVVVCSCKVMSRNGNPNPVHQFDSGAAFENLCLQGAATGLVVHGMSGFDADAAREKLGVPDNYSINAMIAIGNPAPADSLPEDLQEMEKPSSRKPLSEIICEGPFVFRQYSK